MNRDELLRFRIGENKDPYKNDISQYFASQTQRFSTYVQK